MDVSMHGLEFDHYNYPRITSTTININSNIPQWANDTANYIHSPRHRQSHVSWQYYDVCIPTITHNGTVNPHMQPTTENKATIVCTIGSRSNLGHSLSHNIETTISSGLCNSWELVLHQTLAAVTIVG